MDWSGVDYLWIIVMFLSVWTLILTAPIHCRGSLVNAWCNFSKSVPIKKQTYLHIWSEGDFSANFWVNYSFKYHLVLTNIIILQEMTTLKDNIFYKCCDICGVSWFMPLWWNYTTFKRFGTRMIHLWNKSFFVFFFYYTGWLLFFQEKWDYSLHSLDMSTENQ